MFRKRPGKWERVFKRLFRWPTAIAAAIVVFASAYALNIVTGGCDQATDTTCGAKITASWVVIGIAVLITIFQVVQELRREDPVDTRTLPVTD
jgi:uncharacterized membrane protein